jgi:hypothetical protein
MEWELKPGDTVDAWTLAERLGRGGNGEVWLAEHLTLGRGDRRQLSFRLSDD